MYIQMEFCESTLRSVIDADLYKNETRVMRMLREIVEGLSHIHEQGIIHRDLKPVNIFIDSEDHVKIGDFGLATTNILSKTGVLIEHPELTASHGMSITEASHTGQVGTALYVAPELNTNRRKVKYNQKVDIYSLGIIFFEMSYYPLQTEMERIKVLTNLRLEKYILPPDFKDDSKNTRTQLLKWMLNYDPLQRPSSTDLLHSDLLPPPHIEERQFQEIMRSTIPAPQSKNYKHLLESCFGQTMTTAENVTFDLASSKACCTNALSLHEASEKVIKVLKLHGAISLSPPLLVPNDKSKSAAAVPVMTRGGGVAMLPCDLRRPFARFLALNPTVTRLKRYAIDRVYRERQLLRYHPRELYECAFDIVTPAEGAILAKSELLSVMWEVVNQFPALLHSNCVLRLGHTSLLRAVLLHSGLDNIDHERVCSHLYRSKETYTQQFLSELNLPEQKITVLLSLLNQEFTLDRMKSCLESLLRRIDSNISDLCQEAHKHLEEVINIASDLEFQGAILISPGVVNNWHLYSGLLCQMVWDKRDKKCRNQRIIIASGGCYKRYISHLRHSLSLPKSAESQSVVGISFPLNRLASVLDSNKATTVDVVVSSIGSSLMIEEKLRLAKELWTAGIRAYLLDCVQNLEGIENFCKEMNVPNILILKDTDPGLVRLRYRIKDWFQEHKINQTECVESMLKMCSKVAEVKTELRSNSIVENKQVANIVSLVSDKKSGAKRRYEAHVLNVISPKIQSLSAKVKVNIIILDVENEVIKLLAAYIQPDSETHDLTPVIQRFPKQKSVINLLDEQLQKLKCNSPSAIILYSIMDNTYKVIL